MLLDVRHCILLSHYQEKHDAKSMSLCSVSELPNALPLLRSFQAHAQLFWVQVVQKQQLSARPRAWARLGDLVVLRRDEAHERARGLVHGDALAHYRRHDVVIVQPPGAAAARRAQPLLLDVLQRLYGVQQIDRGADCLQRLCVVLACTFLVLQMHRMFRYSRVQEPRPAAPGLFWIVLQHIHKAQRHIKGFC